MAATEHRRLPVRVVPVVALLAGLLAAGLGLGSCGGARGDGDGGALPALPAPALAGLRLTAVVHPPAADGEVRVEATLHLAAADLDGDPDPDPDPDPDGEADGDPDPDTHDDADADADADTHGDGEADGDPVLRLPGGSVGTGGDGWSFLAHRRRLPGGGVVLSLGRGGPFDPADPPTSPRGIAQPAPAVGAPRLVPAGTSLTGSGPTTRWPAEAGDPARTVAVADVAEVAAADEVRVCVWGAVGPLAAVTAPDPPEWEEVVCADVPGPGG